MKRKNLRNLWGKIRKVIFLMDPELRISVSNSAQTRCVYLFIKSNRDILLDNHNKHEYILKEVQKNSSNSTSYSRTKYYFLSLINIWRTTRRSTRPAKLGLRPNLKETSESKWQSNSLSQLLSKNSLWEWGNMSFFTLNGI